VVPCSSGVLPEGLGLFESLTVIENLMAVGPIYGLTKSETAARAADLLGASRYVAADTYTKTLAQFRKFCVGSIIYIVVFWLPVLDGPSRGSLFCSTGSHRPWDGIRRWPSPVRAKDACRSQHLKDALEGRRNRARNVAGAAGNPRLLDRPAYSC
jgi:hypothetical protein